MLVPACGSRCAREGASSEAEPARGGREPSSEVEPARRGRGPSSEAEPARGGRLVGPRGPPQRGPRRVCVLKLEVCFVLFFAGFKLGSLGFLGDPQGCP
jgi:hypothetical protein